MFCTVNRINRYDQQSSGIPSIHCRMFSTVEDIQYCGEIPSRLWRWYPVLWYPFVVLFEGLDALLFEIPSRIDTPIKSLKIIKTLGITSKHYGSYIGAWHSASCIAFYLIIVRIHSLWICCWMLTRNAILYDAFFSRKDRRYERN